MTWVKDQPANKIVPWLLLTSLLLIGVPASQADRPATVVDIPTRPQVTQRFVYLAPENPKAAAILFAGGDGGLQIQPDGTFKGGADNFLVRTRKLFVKQGLAVAVIDAPSDRQNGWFLGGGFRESARHVADVKAVIAWLRQQGYRRVWLIGTSRGTQSAAYVAIALSEGGPDGLVLTSTILSDDKEPPVTAMPLEKLRIPVLVVHHEQDGCKHCSFASMPRLMKKLKENKRAELITFRGGIDEGSPCEAHAYHGFNGLDVEVVGKISTWIQQCK
jgi:dienelactone hydrolase